MDTLALLTWNDNTFRPEKQLFLRFSQEFFMKLDQMFYFWKVKT